MASFLAIVLIFYVAFLGFNSNQNGSFNSSLLNSTTTQSVASKLTNTSSLNSVQSNVTSNNNNIIITNNESTKESSSSNSVTTSQTNIVTNISYKYRDAQYGDDFAISTNLENCVVITGINNASNNGEYYVPETINGKKVVAIMPLAFCEESIKNTVKKVIVPSTVLTIWNNAFAECYNLSDIYFCGERIYTENNAFADPQKRNQTLTIHCSSTCSDRNFRYYKNTADSYGAVFAQWEG